MKVAALRVNRCSLDMLLVGVLGGDDVDGKCRRQRCEEYHGARLEADHKHSGICTYVIHQTLTVLDFGGAIEIGLH